MMGTTEHRDTTTTKAAMAFLALLLCLSAGCNRAHHGIWEFTEKDLRNRGMEDVELSLLAYIGKTDTGVEVFHARYVITGMMAPRGVNYIVLRKAHTVAIPGISCTMHSYEISISGNKLSPRNGAVHYIINDINEIVTVVIDDK